MREIRPKPMTALTKGATVMPKKVVDPVEPDRELEPVLEGALVRDLTEQPGVLDGQR
jgi:hypothetical protein